MSLNFGQFPTPRLPIATTDIVVGYQLVGPGAVPTLAQYSMTQLFAGAFPGGVVPVSQGGTGLSVIPTGDVLIGNNSTTLNFAIPGAAGGMLLSTGTSLAPVFANNPILSGATINNSPIGATTPSAGAFTTLISTGNFTPSQTNGIVGTTANNNANAGSVGEYLTAATAGTGLTNNVAANAASISLTAGDWDVSGYATYAAGVGALTTTTTQGLSATSATFGATNTGSFTQLAGVAQSSGAGGVNATPVQRFSLAATTTVFLVAQAAFTGGTLAVSGFIRARRVR